MAPHQANAPGSHNHGDAHRYTDASHGHTEGARYQHRQDCREPAEKQARDAKQHRARVEEDSLPEIQGVEHDRDADAGGEKAGQELQQKGCHAPGPEPQQVVQETQGEQQCRVVHQTAKNRKMHVTGFPDNHLTGDGDRSLNDYFKRKYG